MYFYILSFSQQGKDPDLVFWRDNCKGYTTNLLEAGKFPLNEVKSQPSYYHSGPNSILLPVHHIHWLTKGMKAEFEPRLGHEPRLIVRVIPIKEARGMMLSNQEFGAYFEGKDANGGWHWRVLMKPEHAEVK